MNRTQLIADVAVATELKQADVEAVLKASEAQIAETLKAGEVVQLSGFGTYKTSEQAARQGRNPANGEPLTIKASNQVSFSVGAGLKQSVNN